MKMPAIGSTAGNKGNADLTLAKRQQTAIARNAKLPCKS